MKLSKLHLILLIPFILSSCIQMRSITEQQIKTNVESHIPNEFSSIRTYSIFKGSSIDKSAYIELTGFKYRGQTGLMIGADKYYLARKKFAKDSSKIAKIRYLILNKDEVKSILVNYRQLLERIKDQKISRNEEVYYDFTVNKYLFVSFHKIKFKSMGNTIDFWIDGDKYTLNTKTIIGKLEKFMRY